MEREHGLVLENFEVVPLTDDVEMYEIDSFPNHPHYFPAGTPVLVRGRPATISTPDVKNPLVRWEDGGRVSRVDASDLAYRL